MSPVYLAHLYTWLLWVGSCPHAILSVFPVHVAGLGRWFGC